MSNLWIRVAAGVCPACGFNLPHHATRCLERGISPLQLRLELASGNDSDSDERCARCGGRIGFGKAVIEGGELAHARDCSRD
jgi:DNA-directed RNA polymerase subunit RPC12/RpoP